MVRVRAQAVEVDHGRQRDGALDRQIAGQHHPHLAQVRAGSPRTDAQRSLLWPRPRVTRPPLCARRVERNGLDDSAKQAVRAAWGDRSEDLYGV